ncbi:MAG: hypothetical protein K8T25_14620 [Planctomycetia bacterium]|nr:hypothetical protein [Planctomycetia bacterium]
MKADSGGKASGGRGVPQTAAQQAAAVKEPPKVPVAAKSATAKAAKPAAEAPPPPPLEPESKEEKKAAKARAKQEKKEAKARAKAEKAERKKSAKSDNRRMPAGGPKQFLILHAEKIVLTVGGLLAMTLIFLSFGRLELNPDQTPEDLNKNVDVVKAKLASTAFDDYMFPPSNFDLNIRRWKTPLATAGFSFPASWDPLLVPPQKRGDPEIYPVEDPLAIAGDDAVYVKVRRAAAGAAPAPAHPPAGAAHAAPAHAGGAAPPAHRGGPNLLRLPPEMKLGDFVLPALDPNEKNPKPRFTEGRRWVTVVAVLPSARQRVEYDHQFGNAFEYLQWRDHDPLYSEVRIKRLEVSPGTPDSALDWSKAKVLSWNEQVQLNNAEKSTWYDVAPEVVPPEFICDDSKRLPNKFRAAGMGVLTKPLAPLVTRSWHQWAIHPRLLDLMLPPEPPASDQDAEPAGDDKPVDMAPLKPAGDVVGPFDDPKPAVAPPKKPADGAKPPEKKARAPKAPPKRTVDYQLVRVFDYTVEPGKHYRYQLQLAVRNPNYVDPQSPPELQIKLRNLKRPESRKEEWIFSPWSAATNEVAIPSGSNLLAVAIATTEAGEEVAKVFVRILNFDTGELSAGAMTLRRGELASGTVKAFTLKPLDRAVSPPADTRVQTDLTLVDFHRIGKVPGSLASPCEMLFVDSSGNTVVQSSVQDELQASIFQRIIEGAGPMGAGAEPMGKNDDAGALFKAGGQ